MSKLELDMDPVEAAAVGSVRIDLRHRQGIIDAFHMLSYDERGRDKTWGATTFKGYPVWKLPQDLWLYRDVIMQCKPKTIVETGTAHGGSALYFVSLLDEIGKGGVVLSIDIARLNHQWPAHPRIFYAPGRSSLEGIPPAVRHGGKMDAEMVMKTRLEEPVMVVLDSDHRRDHVRAELDVYGPLVTPGQYLVIEDSNVGGHPVLVEHGPGPREALEDWLPRDDFREDRALFDRHLFSYNTWLRKI